MSETQRNKGGRPTKAEQIAKGITKSELEAGLRVLKKAFVPSIQYLIDRANDTEVSMATRIKLHQMIASMFPNYLQADQRLKTSPRDSGSLDTEDPEDKPTAVVFNLV